MKKIALLIFAILMLGCDTETPMIEEPAAIEEPSLVTASGEGFRLDIAPPMLLGADVVDGQADVDPEPLNANGIDLVFDSNLKLYKVDLRRHEGESLGWLPRGVVDHEHIGPRIQISPVAGSPLLEFDTAYVIGFYVQDFNCESLNWRIHFQTKPKP